MQLLINQTDCLVNQYIYQKEIIQNFKAVYLLLGMYQKNSFTMSEQQPTLSSLVQNYSGLKNSLFLFYLNIVAIWISVKLWES